MASAVTIRIDDTSTVSALIDGPADAAAVYVFAHGAGAGMEHPSMARMAEGLAQRGIAVLRYRFPYMERKSRRPDPPKVAHAAVRAAVDFAAARWPGARLFAGGRSFGGRMTSQAQALTPLQRVAGLVFIGFPLHPAGKPSIERAAHLCDVTVPMLFLQGTRDELADPALLRSVIASLKSRASLQEIDDADHSFHVRRSSGRDDAQVREAMLDSIAQWFASFARS
ncbi:MAG TPA: dienelactone hydrolase family protein [Burkholderiaceae bacterium]|nr:dienelactone hydrolase family protein [Burkholderiaceae bacterium]